MIFNKIKNLNYFIIFLLMLLSFIGAAGLYSAADGSYEPSAAEYNPAAPIKESNINIKIKK